MNIRLILFTAAIATLQASAEEPLSAREITRLTTATTELNMSIQTAVDIENRIDTFIQKITSITEEIITDIELIPNLEEIPLRQEINLELDFADLASPSVIIMKRMLGNTSIL